MEMICDRARHELYRRLRKRPLGISSIPAHVNGDLAHGKRRGKKAWVFIHHSFESRESAILRGTANPIIANLITGIRNVSEIEVRPAPQPIGLGLNGLIDEVHGN